MTQSGVNLVVTGQWQMCLHSGRHQEHLCNNFPVLIKFKFARRLSKAKLNTLRLYVCDSTTQRGEMLGIRASPTEQDQEAEGGFPPREIHITQPIF